MLTEIVLSQSTCRNFLKEKYQRIRRTTEGLCKPLSSEDCLLSATEETSPPKWHLAHTTWFFENFILRQQGRDFPTFNPTYNYLFNSYYKTLGAHLTKKDRSLLSRPTLEQIFSYRVYTDEHILNLIETCDEIALSHITPVLELGMNHEQQHQELLLMDVKQNFFEQAYFPAYLASAPPLLTPHQKPMKNEWRSYPGGLVEIGCLGNNFYYDNEQGRHREWLEPFQLSTNLVTQAEFMEFMEAGGYENPQYWLSDGWDLIQKNRWKSPHYWVSDGKNWKIMTLYGLRTLDPAAPVSHVSYYEAQAYANFRKARLPTEAEWESVAVAQKIEGQFLEDGVLEAIAATPEPGYDLHQVHGSLWEWTQSAYLPYPGYVPFGEGLGEYNSKFMCNQFVLRGGSCITPIDHYRSTYRNFYYPHMRWQYCGFRMARDGTV